MTAFRRAGLLRYAAVQFVVLVGAAMALFAGGNAFARDERRYELTGNFLSDLGMTRAWSGRPNAASSILFGIALASLGGGLVSFAWSWRELGTRARPAGIASAFLGTASGLCFVGIAVTPFDLALDLHNGFVFGAFGLLLGYVVALCIYMWRNDATAAQKAANLAFVALVLSYVILIFFGPRLSTHRGWQTQIVGQKLVAFGSVIYVVTMTTLLRRQLAARRSGT
ncbi:MAG TPA: hypothetical protein VGM88_00815 [Kofleriaceae bacterium]|jgi:hypothetical protein